MNSTTCIDCKGRLIYGQALSVTESQWNNGPVQQEPRCMQCSDYFCSSFWPEEDFGPFLMTVFPSATLSRWRQ